MTDFLNSAASRETSQEIIDAIWKLAGGDEKLAKKIWNAPSEPQQVDILDMIKELGDPEDFVWGDHGDQWQHRFAYEWPERY